MTMPEMENGVIVNAMLLTAEQVCRRAVRCPVCGNRDFRRWPLGWDGHAEFKCGGLDAKGLEERKTEFREKCGHLVKKWRR